ncbi:MAG: hypothetical protein LAO09_22115 [Acidobacteriia bacterium]|nr:hypothetical protein [Terriglobia bacterium]
MSSVAAISQPKNAEIVKFKKFVEEQGMNCAQLESEALETKQKLPVLERSIQFAGDLAARSPVGTVQTLDAGSLHASAKLELDTFVQVSIDPPVPIPAQQAGQIWDTNEKAMIGVQVRSMCLPVRDVVVELRVDGGVTLLPIPIVPSSSPNKRFIARLEPGMTQKLWFWALAPSHPTQATFAAVLSGEVVPYACRFPSGRVVTIGQQ